jgi:adenylylsulfate kinase
MKKFNWKNKTGVYLGRFQPFHDGHKKIFLKTLKKDKQVAILVMDSYRVGKKNPFTFTQVKKRIDHQLKKYKDHYIVIKVPVVSRFVYGRKVGYKIEKVKLSEKLENISATKIRKNLNN